VANQAACAPTPTPSEVVPKLRDGAVAGELVDALDPLLAEAKRRVPPSAENYGPAVWETAIGKQPAG